MKHLIDELNTVPGVLGCCLFSPPQGLLASNLPGIFRPERLEIIGRYLTKLLSAGRMSFADLTDISLHYDESILMVREVSDEQLLFAVCDPGVNLNLLTVSFNLLQEELRRVVPLDEKNATPVFLPDAVKNPVGWVDQDDARLSELLETMKKRLSKVIGPMASFIFEEALETWQRKGQAKTGDISALCELLNNEIADEEKINSYRELISAELRGYREGG